MSQQEPKRRGRPRIRSPKKKLAKLGQGSAIRRQSREMVCAVRAYFEQERENGKPLIEVNKVVERTACALNINKNTVVNIGKEKAKKEEEGAGPSQALLETPGKSRRRRKTITNLDSFQQDAVRRHVYRYYEKREYPTLAKLYSSLQTADLFFGSKSSLRLCLIDLGFNFEKCCNRTVLMERSDIVAWRCRYLRAVRQVDYDSIVWLDETWVNAGHTMRKGWTDHTALAP